MGISVTFRALPHPTSFQEKPPAKKKPRPNPPKVKAETIPKSAHKPPKVKARDHGFNGNTSQVTWGNTCFHSSFTGKPQHIFMERQTCVSLLTLSSGLQVKAAPAPPSTKKAVSKPAGAAKVSFKPLASAKPPAKASKVRHHDSLPNAHLHTCTLYLHVSTHSGGHQAAVQERDGSRKGQKGPGAGRIRSRGRRRP